MTFELLPNLAPWFVGFAVVVALSLLLTVVAVVDAVRSQRSVPQARPVETTARPARRSTARLHHAA
jgi:Na+-transporting methylmalonyl-CoA/oxaloacetate decarboxylase gamma subunit